MNNEIVTKRPFDDGTDVRFFGEGDNKTAPQDDVSQSIPERRYDIDDVVAVEVDNMTVGFFDHHLERDTPPTDGFLVVHFQSLGLELVPVISV